ncbi:hypothetical protein WJX72_000558 [[Myrmecia] bisecta]|uniref:Double-strand break repair protein n=1 Tax=[Myrmecia] bisecta TaxID=41462 RepID=A0AAW1PWE4_9CHLO
MADDESDNVVRILIATDNHLGVWEKDEVRKDDSFITFEEILSLAQQQQVDMVLLGGDLFHDNKPSRTTVVRAMEILSKYCLNDQPVSFQVLSDQAQNFANGRVNFENPNFNVGLPVFTIHGNHDDPGGADNLSAVDVLSTCNLVNYFGKVSLGGSGMGKIQIVPVLLQKGTTRVALYGLGNVRDERLGRMFQTPGQVEWVRPQETEGYPLGEWFNIFCLHQNRIAHSQNAKNCIREGYLARFLDFVIWGHEHECLADPWESTEANSEFSVIQPGSSVATALSEGESKRKHVVLLEVLGEQFRTVKYPLESVRPFMYQQVVLSEQLELDPENPQSITTFLEQKVESMIATANSRRVTGRTAMLPLIRLKVDYSGFSTINAQRFGQKFVGNVANPHDMLLWHKAPVRKAKPTEAGPSDAAIRPEALDERQIEDLVEEHLVQNLEILQANELADALHTFVEKDEKQALADCVTTALRERQSSAISDERTENMTANDEQLAAVLRLHTQQQRARQDMPSSSAAPRAHGSASRPQSANPALATAAANGARATHSRASELEDGIDEMDIDEGPSSRGGRAGSSRPGSSQAAGSTGRGRGGRQATLGEAFARRPAARAPLATTSNTQHPEASQAGGTQLSRAGGKTPARAASTRKAAARGRQRMAVLRDSDMSEEEGSDAADDLAEEIEDSDDDVVLVDEPAARKRKAAVPTSRSAAASTGTGRGRGGRAGASKETAGSAQVGSFVVDSDDDDVPVVAPVRRRRAGGSQAPSQAQPGSQVTARGWGAAR